MHRVRNANPAPIRSEPWHWVSYPVLNITNSMKTANVFFEELLGTHRDQYNILQPDVLQEIQWNQDNTPHSILWENDWGIHTGNNVNTDLSSHSVTSQQGYKIQLIGYGEAVPENAPAVILHESGFQTHPTNYVNIHGDNMDIYENWIGYYANVCTWPQDAFASIWDDIIMIKAKDWCLYRSRNNHDFSGIEGTMRPLQGDMVVVATANDHPEFQWNVITHVEPITKSKPEYFTYDEKPDYVPVTINLTGIDRSSLKEIGLKLNGDFKGAVVVENDVEQLCAYLGISERLTEGNVELIFYYHSAKNQQQEMKSINLAGSMLSSENINGNADYPTYKINVNSNDLENMIVPAVALEQNYPNPFNPTTRIGYSLKDDGNVSLDIYNVKGQLVKTLFRGRSTKGSFNTSWEGKDNSDKACSSGIYFCKLRTADKILVRKMMLMK